MFFSQAIFTVDHAFPLSLAHNNICQKLLACFCCRYCKTRSEIVSFRPIPCTRSAAKRYPVSWSAQASSGICCLKCYIKCPLGLPYVRFSTVIVILVQLRQMLLYVRRLTSERQNATEVQFVDTVPSEKCTSFQEKSELPSVISSTSAIPFDIRLLDDILRLMRLFSIASKLR